MKPTMPRLGLLLMLAACSSSELPVGESPGGGATARPAHESPAPLSAAPDTPAAPEASAADTPNEPALLELETLVIDNPRPRPKARFGHAVCLLDHDGDGRMDLAVGADFESAVFILRQTAAGEFQLVRTYGAAGAQARRVRADGLGFGQALVAGQFDADPADELVVAARGVAGGDPRAGVVHVLGLGDAPLVIAPESGEEGAFGQSLAVGDFDGDGRSDLALSAPRASVLEPAAGRVIVLFGPLTGGRKLVLDNPFPVPNGSFGHVISSADWNSDGVDDLVVCAIGNASEGRDIAGELYVFTGPLDAARVRVLRDPAARAGDLPRFGMHMAARGPLVAVGSPRKDHGGVEDTGLGVLFRGPSAGSVSLHAHPFPFHDAILGYRVLLADVLGDARPDLLVATLPVSNSPAPGGGRGGRGAGRGAPAAGAGASSPGGADPQARPNRGLFVWDGAAPGQALHLRAAPGSEDHFPQGVHHGQLFAGGKEELVFGDPTWDQPGDEPRKNVGRVVIYRRRP